jgi:hypothetical protein
MDSSLPRIAFSPMENAHPPRCQHQRTPSPKVTRAGVKSAVVALAGLPTSFHSQFTSLLSFVQLTPASTYFTRQPRLHPYFFFLHALYMAIISSTRLSRCVNLSLRFFFLINHAIPPACSARSDFVKVYLGPGVSASHLFPQFSLFPSLVFTALLDLPFFLILFLLHMLCLYHSATHLLHVLVPGCRI